MKRATDIILRVAEVALLVPAFALLIPPVPSEEGHVYHFHIVLPTALFITAQAVGIVRDRPSWWTAVIKTALFIVFGWLVFERVTMGPMN